VSNIHINTADGALAFYDDLLATGSPRDALAESISKYPEHAVLLSDAALTRMNPQSDSQSDPSLQSAVKRASRRAADRFRPSPPSSLLGAMKELGITSAEFSVKMRIGATVVRKLDQRMVAAGTIPSAFINRLADVLADSFTNISNYLQQPSALSAISQGNSLNSPTAKTETFESALKTSVKLGELDRASFEFWMSDSESGSGSPEE
jgi:hypothetical protein